ncbi:tail fiber domain-containing protein [Undibacterium curvum]|uniref:tail fiber domain-containing protein n=1 Tax=Undibacterium curvum TaxID=2762294 RepID=UPI003D0E6690
MGDRFYPGQRDYLAQLNTMDQQIRAANSATSPVFVNLSVGGDAYINRLRSAASAEVLRIAYGTLTKGVKIKTRIPASEANAMTVRIVGAYNSYTRPIEILLSSYFYQGAVYIPTATIVSGGDTSNDPVLQVGVEDGCYAIWLSGVGVYLPRLIVSVIQAGILDNYIEAQLSGWTWVDEAATNASYRNVTTSTMMGAINGVVSTRSRMLVGGAVDDAVSAVVTSGMVSAGGVIRHATDNAWAFGDPTHRATQVYCAAGVINTSDAREKTPVSPLQPAAIAAAQQLLGEIGLYQWLAAVQDKGADARYHIGMTVQRAIEIMRSHGLEPMRYGFVCYDKWDAEVVQRQTNVGQKITRSREVQRQKVRTVTRPETFVENVAGRFVRKTRQVEVEELVVESHPVFGEQGAPVLVDGVQLTVDVPVMEPVVEQYEVDAEPVFEDVVIRPAGDRYAFRYEQLNLFLLAGLFAMMSGQSQKN